MKDTEYRAWYAGRYWQIQEINFAGEVVTLYSKTEHSTETVPIGEVVFEQSTSLFDKNGKEIYSGDIIIEQENDCSKCGDENICNDGKCPLKETCRDIVDLGRFRYWLKNESFGYEGEDLVHPYNCEIIGNIHENPELIEEPHADR